MANKPPAIVGDLQNTLGMKAFMSLEKKLLLTKCVNKEKVNLN